MYMNCFVNFDELEPANTITMRAATFAALTGAKSADAKPHPGFADSPKREPKAASVQVAAPPTDSLAHMDPDLENPDPTPEIEFLDLPEHPAVTNAPPAPIDQVDA
jgi:hypothetical protein